MLMTIRALVVFAVVGGVSLVGCSEIERTYDCARICDRYSDCFDKDLDVSQCVDRCEDKGEDDQEFADKASACEECVSDESCSSASTQCLDKCAEVVIVSTM